MTLSSTRRRFLGLTTGATAGLGLAAGLPGGLAAALAQEAPAPADVSSWDAVRSLFVLDPSYAHFASFFFVSHPRPVREAIEQWRKALDHDPFHTVEHGMFSGDEQNIPLQVAAKMAPYLGSRAEDIAVTGSTTESLAMVYHALPLKPGDEVLTTTHDHYSHHESARMAAARAGATTRRVKLYDPGGAASVDQLVGRLLEAVTPKTRVVGLTWVHSSSGMRLPLRVMAAALKQRHPDLVIVVDGVHGLGNSREAVAQLGIDYFCAGCHKWMFAPRGTGLVWADADGWARLQPAVPTFSEWEAYEAWAEDRPVRTPNNAARMTPGGFHAYEHQWAMGAAFDLHRTMGRERVAERIGALNTRLKDRLADNPRITLHTPRAPELSSGLVAFEVEGLTPQQVVERLLQQRIVASTSPYAVTYARLAPSLVNTEAEVDRAADAVLALAG